MSKAQHHVMLRCSGNPEKRGVDVQMSTTVKTSKSAAQVHRLRLHARTSMTNQLEGIIDLRGWLALIDGFGELRHIDGAHWDEEIGAASQVNYLSPSPPALMFDDITGYRSGQRVLSASIANARRLGVTLRLGTALDGGPPRAITRHTKYLPVRCAKTS